MALGGALHHLSRSRAIAFVDRTDDELMAAWRRGETGAFERLYARYRQPLYGFLLHQCDGEAIALELFQDVWLRVIAVVDAYEASGKFRSWLFTLAHHRLVDHYRKIPRTPSGEDTADTLPAPDPSPEEAQVASEEAAAVRRMLAELPAEQREAMLLREEAGFSLAEIAAVQEVPSETVKSRLRYGYAKLRQQLARDHDST